MGFRGAFFALLSAALFGHTPVFASSGGITGQSTAGCTLGGCHGDAPGSYNYSGTVERFTGSAWTSTSTTVARNAAVSIRYYLSYNSGSVAGRGGFDMSANGGTLSESDGTIQNIGGELTHTTPRTLTGNDINFNNITWTAPNSSGTFTIFTCGQPVSFAGDGNANDGPHRCDTLSITVNDPPVIGNVANQVINEDGTTGALAFTVSDAETAATSLTVTRSSSDTTLIPTANVVLGGSGSNRTVTVTPAADRSGSATITITVTDGNSQTDTDTFLVTVNAVNDAPSSGDTFSATPTYIENGAAQTIDSAVSLTDVDSSNLGSATIAITGNFSSTQDTLNCPSPAIPGISCSYDSASGVLTLSGTAALASYQSAIQDVSYQNGSDAPSPSTRTVRLIVTDSSGSPSTADTTTVNITATNDTPVAVTDSATVDEDSSLNGLNVLANDTDVDGGSDTKTVTLVNGGAINVCPAMTAVTNGSVCKSGATANNTLSFTPTAGFVGATSFTYTMQDSGAATSTATVNITVANVGDAPVAVDDSSTVDEDSSGNVLDVLSNDTDPDSGSGDTKKITQVNGATVAVCPATTAVTNGTVCRSSTSANNTLSFSPAANFAGSASFDYTVEDTATLFDTGTVTVTVTALNDAPSISAPPSIGVTEDSASALTGISFADVDAASGTLLATFTVGSGALAAASGGGVTAGGTATARTLSGTLASLNTFLSGGNLTFTTDANGNSSVSLGIALSDGGNTGSGGTQSATPAAVTLAVTAVNDAPQITSTADTTADDGVAYTYALVVSDPDDSSWTFGLSNEPAGMAVDAAGIVTWTPPCSTTLSGYTTALITASAADGGENGASPATQSWQITVAAPDGDGDGMPNCYELANGFNPADGTDGGADRDGDGRSNAEEFAQGSNPDLDDVDPLVEAPADLVVTATGYETPVDLGTATASDGLDGPLAAVVDNPGPFRPGHHLLTWTVEDAAGNVATDTQELDVVPLANFDLDQVADGDGGTATVRVILNGVAPAYPVTIDYATSGSLSAPAGSVIFGDGETEASLPALSFSGGQAGSITFTMTNANGAAIGARGTHTVTVTTANVAPVVELAVTQAAPQRMVFLDQADDVTFSAVANDPNPGDLASLTYNWQGTAAELLPPAGNVDSFTVPLGSLVAGTHVLRVQVTDTDGASATAELLVVVADTMPTLTTANSDGEGADDLTEGFADFDADGVPDYRDAHADPAVLQDQTGAPLAAELLETETGLELRLGRTSLAAGRTGALIAMSDIVTVGVGQGGLPLGADSYDNVGGLFDFEVHGLAVGGSARVVLPLQSAIRDGAVYRKFDPAAGWHDFVVDADNRVASAFSTLGQCPGPASSDYADGLQPFADCVRLTLTDGGPNDADGMADGVIRDPGGVAITSGSGGGDTTSVSSGAFLALWLLPLVLLRLRRRAGLALLALAATLAAAPAQADHHIRIHYSGDVASGFDSNVTNAQADDDIRESGFASAAGNVDYVRNLSLYTTLLLRGSAQGEYWNSFDGLNNGKGTAMARLLYRADGDFYTPTFAGWVSGSVMEFDSAIRDSNEYRAGVFVTENLTTQVSGRLALGASRRESDGLVYDLSGYSASLNLDWVAAARTVVYTGYQYYVGDVASTASSTSFWIVDAAEAIEADDAFGGLDGGLLAYRLDAKAHIATLGFNYAFSRKLSADVQGQYISTRATERIDYERMVGVVSLLARF